MKILGIGLSGLVGSRVSMILDSLYDIQDVNFESGVDITNKSQIQQIILSSDADWVFHFAAFTNVDGAENDRLNGVNGKVWDVNVLATETIAQACFQSNKRLLYISTDYVFDGEKMEYSEIDAPNPQSWYGTTKFEGEKKVLNIGDLGLIIRIANPYRSEAFIKPDFVHKIALELALSHKIKAPNDQIFIPTYIDDIANAIKILITENLTGTFHVVGDQSLSPYEAAYKIAEKFKFDLNLIESIKFHEYFVGRASRPFHAVLKNDKINKLGIKMLSFDEGLDFVLL